MSDMYAKLYSQQTLSQNLIHHLNHQETHRQREWRLPRYGVPGLKEDKMTLTLQQSQEAVAQLLDETHLEALFKKDGSARTKNLPWQYSQMVNVVNYVVSDLHAGKISSAEALAQQKEKTIAVLRNNVIDMNVKQNQQAPLVKKIIDDALSAKTESASGTKLYESYQSCIGQLTVVEKWAHRVWEQRGVAL